MICVSLCQIFILNQHFFRLWEDETSIVSKFILWIFFQIQNKPDSRGENVTTIAKSD